MTTDWFPGTLSLQKRALLVRSLAVHVVSGESCGKAFSSLAENTRPGGFRTLLGRLGEEAGKSSLLDLVKNRESLFGSLIKAVIESAESSGTTAIALLRLADYLDQQLHLKNRLLRKTGSSAGISLGSMGALLTLGCFFLQNLSATHNSDISQSVDIKNITLSISTFLLSASGIASFMAGVATALLLLIGIMVVHHGALERIIWKIPLLGEWHRKAVLQHFFSTLALLLNGGVAEQEAIRFASVENRSGRLHELLSTTQLSLDSIAKTLESNAIIPYMIARKIVRQPSPHSAGELLKKTGEFYQEGIVESVSAVTIVLGPLAIAVTGIVVFSLLAIH